jgi:CheY-like chemotaxis protein
MRDATILNVDDDLPTLYARSRMLVTAGSRVIEATNGRDALTLAAEHQPSAVVLDIKLPDMTGWEVTRRLKSDPRTSRIPVLQISAEFTQHGHAEVGRMSGADGYLTAPIESDALTHEVQTVLDRARR